MGGSSRVLTPSLVTTLVEQGRFGLLRRLLLGDERPTMRVELASAKDLQPGQWQWPHVDPAKEWACKGTGKLVYDTEFLDLFEKMRKMFGRPLIINSGYRSPEHNRQVADTGDAGPHTTARAADIRIYGAHAFELLGLALALGVTGIGIQQKGPIESRYLHLDILRAPDYPRPMVWTY